MSPWGKKVRCNLAGLA